MICALAEAAKNITIVMDKYNKKALNRAPFFVVVFN